jgi:hypothetical protein
MGITLLYYNGIPIETHWNCSLLFIRMLSQHKSKCITPQSSESLALFARFFTAVSYRFARMTVFHIELKISIWRTYKIIHNVKNVWKYVSYLSKHSSPKATFLILTTLSTKNRLGETKRSIYPRYRREASRISFNSTAINFRHRWKQFISLGLFPQEHASCWTVLSSTK